MIDFKKFSLTKVTTSTVKDEKIDDTDEYLNINKTTSQVKINKKLKFESTLNRACLGADLIIINTEWDEYKSIDFKKIVKKNNFKIYDMRNLYNPKELKKRNIKYYSVGR